jgi:hypothetical protein
LLVPVALLSKPLVENILPHAEKIVFNSIPWCFRLNWTWKKTISEVSSCVHGSSGQKSVTLITSNGSILSNDEFPELAEDVIYEFDNRLSPGLIIHFKTN